MNSEGDIRFIQEFKKDELVMPLTEEMAKALTPISKKERQEIFERWRKETFGE